jgi:hypothetical protein
MDAPAIEVVFRHPQTARPLDARGVSEIGMTGVGAALGERGLQRHGQACPRTTDHVRQGAVGLVSRVLVIIGMFAIEEGGIGQTEI